jgi:DNA-binding CsgD family transcriptional regulator
MQKGRFLQPNNLIDILDRFAACASDAARWSCGVGLLHDCGSAWVTAGTATRTAQQAVAIRTTTPDVLMDDYLGARLHLEDPWLRHCAATDRIDHLDIAGAAGSALLGHRAPVVRLFADHGVSSAVLIPCYGGARPGGIVLYARDVDAAGLLAHPDGLTDARLIVALLSSQYRPDQDTSPGNGRYAIGNPLTRREREVLVWLATGLRTTRIADRMGIACVTVNKHLLSSRHKLGARTREQALAIAIRDGLITI